MFRKNRALAMILAAILVFVMLFSVFTIVLEADHDCVGDDCAICAVLSVCEGVLHRLLRVCVVAAAALLLARVSASPVRRLLAAGGGATPVSLKVKLSD